MIPEGAVDGFSIVSLQHQGWYQLTSSSASPAHPLLAPQPLAQRFLSLPCASISLFLCTPFSVFDSGSTLSKCMNAAGWESTLCGRNQWGTHTTDWLNMALFLTNWLLIRAVFTPSLSFSLSLQILQERGSRMWRGLSMMSSRCYDADISSLWTSVWHNGDLRGIVHWFCVLFCFLFLFFPLSFVFLFLDVNRSVDWQFVPVHLNWTFFFFSS